MPRVVGRAKRLTVPEELRAYALAPRHLSLLAYLLFDGPMAVNEIAARLEVAPATVSLMVGELDKMGILERTPDAADRRRTIVSITDARRDAITAWLGQGAAAWRKALAPLTDAERALFTGTLAAFERALVDREENPSAEYP
ncbi:MarR family winged helix-turn-helix transcriptional regulator [Yinghuangia sp. ASG 101]|uniref:MarR family winged helix-turn-helix transcriptional regulator n=1 Tax=Yinghuangia sp. ASG 101 TaxID=2896848 RepID=UPI001E28BCE3|nr:MarR family winged helix-turn-helix transcriptional regulator [Yinghuangia sp. ASG 101]UGQ15300.1 MarR family winged helix-turn-helix transcriptional regulator [Yinghuangia sp. ASG 101]